MTISWVPWILWAVHKVLRSEKNGFLCLSLAWAMQFAAGYPVLTYLTTLAVILEFVWNLFKHPENQIRWSLGRLGVITGAGVVALAYNLVWVLPFADFFKLSNYENGANRYQDLGWLDFGTLFCPFDQGHPLLSVYHGPHYWVSTYFVGLPVLCLLLWGTIRLVYKRTPWGILLLLFILSLGVLGLSPFLRSFFPGYSLVIHSGYWLALLVFWIAWLCIDSADVLLEKSSNLKKGLLWLAVVAAVFLASLLVSFLTQAPSSMALMACSLLLAAAAPFIPFPGLRWGTLLLALALSQGTAATSINILLDRSYYEAPPKALAALTKPGRLFFTPPLLEKAIRLQGPTMAKAYEAAKQSLYPDWPLVFGREEAPLYNTFQSKLTFPWTFQASQYSLGHSRRVLDYLNIRYVFGKTKFKDLKPTYALMNETGPPALEVTENPTPLPKWFSVPKALPAGQSLEEDFAKAAQSKLDYGKECFIEDSSKEGNYQIRKVGYLSQGPNRLELTTEGKGPALIVSSESAFPGWKAKVAGRERNLLTVNHSFRGILLNEGETKASLSFEPVTFRLGFFFSLLVLGLWTGLGLRRIFE
jgi:hypothetical protein